MKKQSSEVRIVGILREARSFGLALPEKAIALPGTTAPGFSSQRSRVLRSQVRLAALNALE